VSEVLQKLDAMTPIKPRTRIGRIREWRQNKFTKQVSPRSSLRKPMQINMGMACVGYCLPHPDMDSPVCMREGAKKRMCFDPPRAVRRMLRELGQFVYKTVERHCTPLSPLTDLTTKTWLSHTTYPLWRREQLAEKDAKIRDRLSERYWKCTGFMKDEPYLTWKYPRGIMARSDEFKCIVGPTFKAIEKHVFYESGLRDWFIKKVPVSQRPGYIADRLLRPGATYMATDYTAFESLFTADLMRNCEFILYKFMAKHLPNYDEFEFLLENVLAGRNKVSFKDFDVEVEASRMSGEMCTSLGNGFSNLMFMMFLCHKKGSQVIGVVEGDDGLFSVTGTAPCKQDFRDLGLVIKLEEHTDLSAASFCGLVSDPSDGCNVTDPIKELVNFSWTRNCYLKANSRKMRMLIRAKSLSMLYQYPGCPILSSLALYGLRVTQSVHKNELMRFLYNTRVLDEYQRERFIEVLNSDVMRASNHISRKIGLNTRLLVEAKYGVPIEHQRIMERYLDSLDEVQTLDVPLLDLHAKAEWADYYRVYGSSMHDSNTVFEPQGPL
jgi:hypothetical protein